MRNYDLWLTCEDKYIIDNYSTLSIEGMTKRLGRTVPSIKQHIKQMKLAGNLPEGRKPKIVKRKG